MAEVTVAIPTFRRPLGLQRLLVALAQLNTSSHVRVLVADNDSEAHQGFDLCAKLAAQSYRWPLEALIVPERGISQARNALVERALSNPATEFVAMLDDDEWPEPGWLDALLHMHETSGADVVRGTVLREFAAPPPVWASEWEGIAPIRYATGYSGMIEGIGNVLIARGCLEELAPPRFDPSFGLSGGEDKDFFVRLARAGARFTRCDEAVATEHVPASRLSLRWSLLRAYRTGNSDMRIFLKYHAGLFAMLRELAKIGAAFVSFPILFVILSVVPTRRLDSLRKLFRACGKLGALSAATIMNMQRYTAIDGYAGAAPKSAESAIAEGAFVAFLLIIFVGLAPFAARDAEAIARYPDNGGGDMLRQICYLATFAVIAGMAFMKRGLQAFAALSVPMIVLLGWCMASALWSDQPDITFRRAVLVTIVMCSALLSVDTIGAERSLKLWWYVLAGILIVNCLTSPVLPQAVHLPSDPEPDIVGDWRGLYFHKNIAGSVTATSAIVFFYSWLRTRRWLDIALCVGALGFLAMTVSKSSLGLLPVALAAGGVYRLTQARGMDRTIALVAALLFALIAGTALIAWWDRLAAILQDPTEFTGRTAIWSAELGFIRDHPLLGSGFGSFAETGDRSPVYNYMGAAWVGTVAQGHHGYLELLVTIGGIGFALAMIALLLQPAWQFWRGDRADPLLKALAFTLYAFFVLHNFMESDFLARDAPEWVTFLLAVAMLRTAQREADIVNKRSFVAPSWAM